MSLKRRWLTFGLISLSGVLLIIALNWLSPALPGTAGAIYQQNVDRDIEANALFYTESGDVRDYLNPQSGKYCGGASPGANQEQPPK